MKTYEVTGWLVWGKDGPLLWTFTDDYDAVVQAKKGEWVADPNTRIAKVQLTVTEIPQ